MSRDEWERLALGDERTPPHQRSKGPVSTPAGRLVELNHEIVRLRGALAEAAYEVKRLETKLNQFISFAGVSFGGIKVSQFWCEFVLWEALLNSSHYNAVFELGTWEGGFSWWLWAQAQARGMKFVTYDSVRPDRDVPCFERRDVFLDRQELGALMRKHEPCIVFCDNGNKPRELEMYSKELRSSSSILVVHDWGTEMLPENVPDNVEMIHREFCEDLGSVSRVFKIKEG